MASLKSYRRHYDEQRGAKLSLLDRLEEKQQRIEELEDQKKCLDEAQAIIQKVAQLTQEELTYHVSELVTLALAAVFDDPYEFGVDFVLRRGRTEADLYFKKGDEKIHPLSASGGGAVDVASFALRVSLWSLQNRKSRQVLILDEPLKWLKGSVLPEKGAKMIKTISDKLDIQIIAISHIPDQIEGADRQILITQKKGKSYVSYSD